MPIIHYPSVSSSSSHNWYPEDDANWIVKHKLDGNELYIEKESSGNTYAEWVYHPEEVGASFDISFRLRGTMPGETYRHFGIALNSDGGTDSTSWDMLILRSRPAATGNNQIRVDIEATTEDSLANASVPTFFDGTERSILIQVRPLKITVEVEGVVEHTMTPSKRTRARGIIGFCIYESANANTWATIRDYKLTQYSEVATILTDKVGIGTESPAAALEIQTVSGVHDANIRLDMNGVNSNHHGIEWYSGGTQKAEITWGESNANLKLRNFRSDANASYGRIDFDVGDTSNPPTRMTVDGSTGNVGIGTTSPDHKLTVASGSIKIAESNSRLVFGTVGGTDRRALEGSTNGATLQVGEGYTTTRFYGTLGVGGAAGESPLTIYRDTGETDITTPQTMIDASHLMLHATQDAVNSWAGIMFTGADHTGDGANAGIFARHTNVTEDSESTGLHFFTADNEVVTEALSINHEGYISLYRDGGDYGLELKSESGRSGVVINKPGTNTIMGSGLVLADESFRLGTESNYHQIMYQSGVTSIMGAGAEVFRASAAGLMSIGAYGYSNGRIRQYNVSAAPFATNAELDLFGNTGAHTDVFYILTMEIFHSSRTYMFETGSIGGYGYYKTTSGFGLGLTAVDVATGRKKLRLTNTSGYSATVYISALIFGDSGVDVYNGVISDQI